MVRFPILRFLILRFPHNFYWARCLVVAHLSQYFRSVAIQILTLLLYFVQFFLDLSHWRVWTLLFLQAVFLEVQLQVLNVLFYCVHIFFVFWFKLFYSWWRLFNWLFLYNCWSWSLSSFLGRCWSFPKLFTIAFTLPQFWIRSFWFLDPILSILCILLNDFLHNSGRFDKIIEACHPHSPLLKSGSIKSKSPCCGLYKKWMLKLFGADLHHLLLDRWLG